MEYRRLGKTGMKISSKALGGWLTFGESIKDQALTQQALLAHE